MANVLIEKLLELDSADDDDKLLLWYVANKVWDAAVAAAHLSFTDEEKSQIGKLITKNLYKMEAPIESIVSDWAHDKRGAIYHNRDRFKSFYKDARRLLTTAEFVFDRFADFPSDDGGDLETVFRDYKRFSEDFSELKEIVSIGYDKFLPYPRSHDRDYFSNDYKAWFRSFYHFDLDF